MLVLALLLLPQLPVPPVESPQEPDRTAEVLVTASGFADDPLDAPWSSDAIGLRELRAAFRSVPEALARTPGVMVQKTAYGQSSPYIRGFTGFRSLMLVDGIRLNHAAMRDGPNQYWSTVDPYLVERLELVRGPSSVLYGSDAIGGTVNAVMRQPHLGAPGEGMAWTERWTVRAATAEDSLGGRGEFAVRDGGRWGLLGGYSTAHFNDLESGAGEQPESGYSQYAGDLRFVTRIGERAVLTVAGQTFRMVDVPRTETTVFAVPYAGTSVGSELRRDQDQTRDLYYARLGWQRGGGWLDEGEVTLSFQRHDERRDRLRSGDRRDLQGFTLRDIGLLGRFRSLPTATGRWSWGFELHHEDVDSFRDNYVAGAYTGSAVQGPIADDATYRSAAAYLQDEIALADDVALVPGLRLSWFDLEAGRVANPDTSPGAPAAIRVEDDWTALTGSLRGLWYASGNSTAWAGLSQGFRAPNLSDLTALDSTSVVETPSPDLEPENFLQAELGWKGGSGGWTWQAAAFHTWIDDAIVRSPTGALIGGVPEVRKDNIGDGWVRGIELAATWNFVAQWSLFANGSLIDGEVDQVDPATGNVVRAPLDRQAPAQAVAGLRWESDGPRGPWLEVWVWTADDADELSLRDTTDSRRIPPGGTPGYTVVGMAAGVDVHERARVSLAAENLTDRNYRVHGSGINGPGLNLVLVVELDF